MYASKQLRNLAKSATLLLFCRDIMTDSHMFLTYSYFIFSQALLEEDGLIIQAVVLITYVCRRIPITMSTRQVYTQTGHMSTLLSIRSSTFHHMQTSIIMTSLVPFAVQLIVEAWWWSPQRVIVHPVGQTNTTVIWWRNIMPIIAPNSSALIAIRNSESLVAPSIRMEHCFSQLKGIVI